MGCTSTIQDIEQIKEKEKENKDKDKDKEINVDKNEDKIEEKDSIKEVKDNISMNENKENSELKEDEKEKDLKEEENKETIIKKVKKKSKGLLSGIKSFYIFKDIFEYICDMRKMHLFAYSKSFQNIFDLSLKDYQEVYFNNLIPSGAIDDYLSSIYNGFHNYDGEKNKRKELYKKFLSDYPFDKNIIEEFIIKKIRISIKNFKVNQFCR